MTELLKIREVSSKYDISARALRYYEDMGLRIGCMINRLLGGWNRFWSCAS